MAAFLAVAALATLDLAGDLLEGSSTSHAVIEASIITVGAVGLGVLLRQLLDLRRRERDALAEAAELGQALERSREERDRWREEARDLLAGLGALIDKQFGRWGLSVAEREVALFLLKGLRHKEVAQARAVSEATARQQAASVYRKAGVAGRYELAAFFLEDLLAPRGAG